MNKDTYQDFLHPEVVQQLGDHLAQAQLLQALKLEQYHVAACEQHLRSLDFPRWRCNQDAKWKQPDGEVQCPCPGDQQCMQRYKFRVSCVSLPAMPSYSR